MCWVREVPNIVFVCVSRREPRPFLYPQLPSRAALSHGIASAAMVGALDVSTFEKLASFPILGKPPVIEVSKVTGDTGTWAPRPRPTTII